MLARQQQSMLLSMQRIRWMCGQLWKGQRCAFLYGQASSFVLQTVACMNQSPVLALTFRHTPNMSGKLAWCQPSVKLHILICRLTLLFVHANQFL